MKNNTKLEAKLKFYQDIQNYYQDKIVRIKRVIAAREGKKLRLVVSGDTLYVVYQAESEYVFGENKIAFFSSGSLVSIPWRAGVESKWRKESMKVSYTPVEYAGHTYVLNSKYQLCRLVKVPFNKLIKVMVVDLKDILGV